MDATVDLDAKLAKAPTAVDNQNGNGSGFANEWFYGDVPGEKIHWSSDAQCKIYKFLGMKNTNCPN